MAAPGGDGRAVRAGAGYERGRRLGMPWPAPGAGGGRSRHVAPGPGKSRPDLGDRPEGRDRETPGDAAGAGAVTG